MQKNIAPIKLPVTQGSSDGGFNANVMYDAEGSSVATLYGLPQSTTLEELGKAVARGDFNNAWAEGAARAAFIVKACNSHDELVAALRKAQEDINWMTNSGKLLNRHVFQYLDDALAKLEAK